MHRVVVSHPYDADGAESKDYEVLVLDSRGLRSSEAGTFRMDRSAMKRIAFTPDGRAGIVAQEQGTLGVFRVSDRGRIEVVHQAFRGPFWASSVLMDPGGERVWVLDTQWAVHGGGIHAVRVESDATLTYEGKAVEAQLPYTLAWVPGTDRIAVLGGFDVLGSPDGHALHLIDLSVSPRRLASADPFEGEEAILSSMAITADGRYVLLGDNHGFSGTGNRVAVVALGTDRLRPVQEFSPVEDPVAIVPSPFGGPVLVVSGFGNAIHVFDYDPNDAFEPFFVRGELPYEGLPPCLPSQAVCIGQSDLAGRVLVSENGGLRQIEFLRSPLGVRDIGLHAMDTSAGALGATGA